MEVGRTSGKKNTLSPVWRDAIFTIQIPATADIIDCMLRVELFDFDAGYGDIPDDIGDFLGCVEVTGKELVQLVIDYPFISPFIRPFIHPAQALC